jgi:hypothetical protein
MKPARHHTPDRLCAIYMRDCEFTNLTQKINNHENK